MKFRWLYYLSHFYIFILGEGKFSSSVKIIHKLSSSGVCFNWNANTLPPRIPEKCHKNEDWVSIQFLRFWICNVLRRGSTFLFHFPNLIHITHSNRRVENLIQTAGWWCKCCNCCAAHILIYVITQKVYCQTNANQNNASPYWPSFSPLTKSLISLSIKIILIPSNILVTM